MAIYGIGADLVQVSRLKRALDRWGGRFERRIFTRAESQACGVRKKKASCLALRFAAKEAFVKALGTGMRDPVEWLDIEVTNDELGRPSIVLSPRAATYCAEAGIASWHLSLTDDGGYAQAFVVLET